MVPGLSLEHIIILGIIALVVVGPKDLPLLLRKLGQWTAKLRGMAQEFRSGFDELARQAELDELKKEVEALRRTTNLTDITQQLARPLGTLESYAGISPPPPALSETETKAEPPPNETPASSSPPAAPRPEIFDTRIASDPGAEAARSAGGDAPAVLHGEPHEAQSSLPSTSPPLSSLRDDSSPIEGEQGSPRAPAASTAP